MSKEKKCSAGADCVHESGPVQPVGNFYDYSDFDGASFTRCKSCIKAANRRRLELDASNEISERLDFLKSYPANRRAPLIFRWIKEGIITGPEFKTIYREAARQPKKRATA